MLSAMSKQPKVLGQYDVLEQVGVGSMSVVHRATHRQTGQVFALKILLPQVSRDPVLLKRFKQECWTTGILKHPHLVEAFDFCIEGKTAYLVLEYVDGGDLWQHLERQGRLPEAEAVRIILQVADALHFAHQHRIIHRDVKPDNILLTSDGQAKLTDLGLAKDLKANLNLTCADKGLGTPNFIAPEQFRDARHAGVGCDVYGLGATLYMAVTGELPFQARGIAGIFQKKINNNLTPPRELVPTLSTRVDWVIQRALRANLSERHSSCLEFSTALTAETTAAPRGGKRRLAVRSGMPREERRASVRYPCLLETQCVRDESVHPEQDLVQDSWEATIQDISVKGAGVVLKRRFEPGTFLTIDLHSADRVFMQSMEVCVQRVRRAARGHWFHGCLFAGELNKEDLRKLL